MQNLKKMERFFLRISEEKFHLLKSILEGYDNSGGSLELAREARSDCYSIRARLQKRDLGITWKPLENLEKTLIMVNICLI